MFPIINIAKLSKICNIEYFKIRNNFAGKYNSLNNNERTEIANAAFLEVNKFFNRLGFHLTMKRLEDVEEKD